MKTLLVLPLILLFALGCQTGPKQKAFITLDAIGAGASHAMEAASDLRVHGKMSDANWQQVRAKHAQFLQAYNLAVDAAANSGQPASAQLQGIYADLLGLIASLTTPPP